MQHAQETLGANNCDRAARTVSSAGKVLDLPRRELALFEVIFDHRGRLLDKEWITTALYGAGAEVESNAVELLVSRLRHKIEGTGVTILTARGLGYMLDESR